MKQQEFDTYFKKIGKLEDKIKLLQIELEEIKDIVAPFIQFHRPTITISTLKGKYWHSNTPIQDGGKLVRHSVYLGSKENFDGRNDKKLLKLAEQKMGELLRKKYPQMFD